MPPQVPPQVPYFNVGNPYGQQVAAAPTPSNLPSLPFFPPPSGPFGAAAVTPVPVAAAPQFGLQANAGNAGMPAFQAAPSASSAPVNAPVSNEIVMQLLQMMAKGQLTPEQSVQVMGLLGLAPPATGAAGAGAQAAPPAAPVVPTAPAVTSAPASNFHNPIHDPGDAEIGFDLGHDLNRDWHRYPQRGGPHCEEHLHLGQRGGSVLHTVSLFVPWIESSERRLPFEDTPAPISMSGSSTTSCSWRGSPPVPPYSAVTTHLRSASVSSLMGIMLTPFS